MMTFNLRFHLILNPVYVLGKLFHNYFPSTLRTSKFRAKIRKKVESFARQKIEKNRNRNTFTFFLKVSFKYQLKRCCLSEI